jgi:hypothetical protein
MPKLPTPDLCLTKEQSLHMILASIAMEEAALSHILNAEGEKIQYAIENAQKCGYEVLLEVNQSAKDVIAMIIDLQMILKEKMKQAIASLPESRPPCPWPPYACACYASPWQMEWRSDPYRYQRNYH